MITRNGAILSDRKGEPKPITLRLRQSETGPERLKMIMTISTEGGVAVLDMEGKPHDITNLPDELPIDVPVSMELRLEMN